MYRKYHGEDLFPAVIGLVMVFFGGTIPLIIAAYEAFKMTGYGPMKEALMELYDQGEKAISAMKKDEDAAPKSQEGEEDKEEETSSEVSIMHKSFVLKAVDPEKVSKACTAVTTGLIAVLGCLKME